MAPAPSHGSPPIRTNSLGLGSLFFTEKKKPVLKDGSRILRNLWGFAEGFCGRACIIESLLKNACTEPHCQRFCRPFGAKPAFQTLQILLLSLKSELGKWSRTQTGSDGFYFFSPVGLPLAPPKTHDFKGFDRIFTGLYPNFNRIPNRRQELNTFFFLNLFGPPPPDIRAKNPGNPAKTFGFPGFRGTYRTFCPPTPSRGRPHIRCALFLA